MEVLYNIHYLLQIFVNSAFIYLFINNYFFTTALYNFIGTTVIKTKTYIKNT